MIAEYLRKSRAEELMDASDVLAKHREFLSSFAKENGIIVSDVYEEVVSGESIAARPQMKALLSAIREGKYDAVLCVDIDRLGRGGMQDQGMILDVFRETGTLIITPDKTYDLSNEQDEMLTEFKTFMSRQEYKIIRKRMRLGLMQTIEAGGYVANPPYGYKPCKKGKFPSLEIVPEEAEFVRYIYRRYQEGAGAASISEEINAMGSVPRRNGKWTRNTVRVVLRNPTYKGMIAWNRVHRNKPGTAAYEKQHAVYTKEDEWMLFPGLHEAIIPEDEWGRVQEIRKKKYIPSKKTGETVNPLSGLVYCSKCGHKMQRLVQKGTPYLLCTTKGCCAAAKLEYVESAIVIALSERLEKLKLKIKANPETDTSAEEEALAATELELVRIGQRINRLFDFLEDGTYDRATFRSRREELERRKSEIERQQEKLRESIKKSKTKSLEAIAVKLDELLAAYHGMAPGEKNLALKELVEKIIYTKEKKTKSAEFTLEIESKDFLW